MRVYLIKHKNYRLCPMNMKAFADIDTGSGNGFYVRSVQAFLKRKEAVQYIADNYDEFAEIVVFESV